MRSLLAFSIALAAPAFAAEGRPEGSPTRQVAIRTEDSIFAVITHKGGFASGVAHNHLVTAAGYQAKLDFEPAATLATRFELILASDQLAVDRWELAKAWYPRLEELGILGEAFTEVAGKDREKIRKSMLAKGQLDAAGFPEISARITQVREASATHGTATFPFAATLELTIHGQSVAKPVAARYELVDGTLAIEAVGAFLFTDFGIQPYSAFLGAVKNEDEFHVYVNLKATLP